MSDRPATFGRTGKDPWVRRSDKGHEEADLLIPSVHCAGCIAKIERSVTGLPGLSSARLNLTTKRLHLEGERLDTDAVVERLAAIGFEAKPFDPTLVAGLDTGAEERQLLRALAIAGFAAANVMLLSVSVWAGAEGTTRDLFHWLSALIALPAVALAGRPFYRSAWQALRHGRLNMDVPISLAVLLAAGISLFETVNHGAEAYFDAAVMLLFFLLIGRYLDHRMRGLARSGAAQLTALAATAADIVLPDGEIRRMAVAELEKGMIVRVAPGDRLPVDGVVLQGRSEIDRSLVTGESTPEPVGPGTIVHAGTNNLTGAVDVRIQATGEGTLLADIVRLVEAAERSKNAYVRLADRAAQIYAPTVHILALATFIGWLVTTGGDWRVSLFTAVAVLIITCPCALGLAVPAVQTVAAGRLLRRGIMMKDGTALERLASIDRVVFDKTGTLTRGEPRFVEATPDQTAVMAEAAALAAASRHPLARALSRVAEERQLRLPDLSEITEEPGFGVRARLGDRELRLGRAGWCGIEDADDPRLSLAFRSSDGSFARYVFEDDLRVDAAPVVRGLQERGLRPAILSGDRPAAVAAIADKLGIDEWRAGCTPGEKVAMLEARAAEGEKILMVGDGLNDAPALATATVSMSPATAAEISQTTAHLVFTGERLAAVTEAHGVGQKTRRLMLQNFGIAAAYNCVAVPIAVAGLASPLVAAIAMSTSSLLVTANALRLLERGPGKERQTPARGTANRLAPVA
ncbi:MAG: heavy metal translocating P-type ATPase [Geminicoccaceae bacterium]